MAVGTVMEQCEQGSNSIDEGERKRQKAKEEKRQRFEKQKLFAKSGGTIAPPLPQFVPKVEAPPPNLWGSGGKVYECGRLGCRYKKVFGRSYTTKLEDKWQNHIQEYHGRTKNEEQEEEWHHCPREGCSYKTRTKNHIQGHIAKGEMLGGAERGGTTEVITQNTFSKSHLSRGPLIAVHQVKWFHCTVEGCTYKGTKRIEIIRHQEEIHKALLIRNAIVCPIKGCKFQRSIVANNGNRWLGYFRGFFRKHLACDHGIAEGEVMEGIMAKLEAHCAVEAEKDIIIKETVEEKDEVFASAPGGEVDDEECVAK